MIRQILSTFFTRFFIAISNLAIAVILSNYTGAAGRGEQSLIITLITFIIIITSVIGSSSISYLLPRHSFYSLIIPSYLWIAAIIALCFILLPFLNLVDEAFTVDICILSFILAIVNVNTAVLVSRQRINSANQVGFVQSVMIVAWLLISFLVIGNKSVSGYVNALYIGYGSSLLLSFAYIGSYFRGIKKESLSTFIEAGKRLTVLGFFNQIAVFTQLLSFRLSYYLLNAYYGNEQVGIYANAVSIAESVWLIGRSIATVQHSRIVNSEDALYSLKLTSRINRINIIITVVIIIIMAFVPDRFYTILFGDEFTGINRIIRIIAPGIVFFGIALILGNYFSSTGKHFVNAIASTAGLFITLLLGFLLIPQYETSGAGITATVSYGITALIAYYFYRRELKKHFRKQ
ncbi:MAG TPA: polysaccharide biosynthesis C-terminal domain-containing protein [Bacteroidales bacterium]|jgi:O-antigen/teichoic acid export membrane protein|nr:polysaccharide biosynthesis C-terminal domain-containing protein [Bacteroidales bacterium]